MSICNSYAVGDVKTSAIGRWADILFHLAGLDPGQLDGGNYPCPICNGSDRFNACRKSFNESGQVFCNQNCGITGDGFGVLMRVNSWDFSEAINSVGHFLSVNASFDLHEDWQTKETEPSPVECSSNGMSYPDAVKAVHRSIARRLPTSVSIADQPIAYRYRNDSGSVVGVVLRWDRSDAEKEIRQLSLSSEGWIPKAIPASRPLFELPEVLAADTVYVAEGEKCAQAVQSFGLIGTTSCGGSSAPAKTDWSVLADKRVVIVPDNDEPGRWYRDKVAALLAKQAPTAKVFAVDLSDAWSEIPVGGDCADWSLQFDTQTPEWFQAELERIAKPIELQPTADTGEPAKSDRAKHGLRIQRATDVVEKPLRWLWKDRFLIGHVNIIAGDPGLGKSMTAVDIAARVSTGSDFPDGSPCEQGVVLYSTTEDGYADTVKPRLNAAGANTDNVLFLDCCVDPDGSEGPVYLDEHLWLLDQHLEQNPDIRLLVLDTLQSFVGARTNTNNNASSRRIMTPLKRLAEKHHVAVLCIEHLNKGSTTKADNATYRIQGSIAFCGAARSVWIVCKDKQDSTLRYLQASKTNLAPDSQGLGLSYTITGPTGRPFIQWQDTNINTPISELLSTDEGGTVDQSTTELDRACEFLKRVVTEPVSAKEIAAGCKAEMISDATLRRAKDQLGIESIKDGKNWLWVPSQQMKQDRIDGTGDLFPE